MSTMVQIERGRMIDVERVKGVMINCDERVCVKFDWGAPIVLDEAPEGMAREVAATIANLCHRGDAPDTITPPVFEETLVEFVQRRKREEEQEGDAPAGLTKRIKVEVDTSELDEAIEKLERVREVQADDQIEHCAGLALFAAKGDSWTQADQHQFLNDFKGAVDTRDEAKEMLRLFAGPDDVPESWEVRDRSKGRRQRTQDRDLAELDGADD